MVFLIGDAHMTLYQDKKTRFSESLFMEREQLFDVAYSEPCVFTLVSCIGGFYVKTEICEPTRIPCLNIIVDECWQCKNDMLVPYYSDDVDMPYGPSNFTKKQIQIAVDAGCLMRDSFSKTMQETYFAAICPHCGAMRGDFFYHDFAYVPGDIQFFLDMNDDILEKKENKPLIQRPFKVFNIETEIQKRENEKDQKAIEKVKLFQMILNRIENKKGVCVRVKFENNKSYVYNCDKPIKIGDSVLVEGKLAGVKGTVVGILGSWRNHDNMRKIAEISPAERTESKG